MATVTRGKIIRGDLANWDGKTATYARPDATGGTITGLAVGNEVDVLQVFGSGTSRTRGAIASAVQYIGSSNVTLRFAPGTWTIDDDLTIPSNFTCKAPAGCIFNVESGQTLTFSGPVIADSDSFYSGSGSTVLAVDSIVDGKGWHVPTTEETAASLVASNLDTALSTEYIRVKRYKAVADGTQGNAAADTLAAQTALSVAAEHGGAKVVFEHGNFVINEPLVPDVSRLELIGDGAILTAGTGIPASGAIICSLSGGADAATNQAILDGIYGADVVLVRSNVTGSLEDVKIRDLTLVANANTGKGIHMTGFTRGSALVDLTLKNFAGHGVALNGSWSFALERLRVNGPGSAGTGIALGTVGLGTRSGSSVCNAINVHGNWCGNHSNGMIWNFGAGGSVTGNTFEGNGTDGFFSQSAKGFLYSGNYHEGNDSDNASFGGTNGSDFVIGAAIQGNIFNASTGNNIRLNGMQQCIIGPNQFTGSATQHYIMAVGIGQYFTLNQIWIPAVSATYITNPSEFELDDNIRITTDTLSLNTFNLSARGAASFSASLAHSGGTLGFYGETPIAQQTGVAVDAAGIHAALVALGLITA